MTDVTFLIVPLALVAIVVLTLCFLRPTLGLVLSVFAMPFYWAPNAFLSLLNRLMTSSQIPVFADLLVLATLAGAMVRIRSGRRFATMSVALAVFVVCCVLSLLNSQEFNRSIGNLLSYVQLLGMVFVVEALVRSTADLQRFLTWWFASLLVVLACGVFGIFSVFTGAENFSVLGTQVRSTFRFPNQLSLYLVESTALLSVGLVGGMSPRFRRFAVFAIPCCVGLMLVSGSRSGIAAGAATGMVLLSFHGRRSRFYVPLAVGLAGAAIWLGSLSFQNENLQDVQQRYSVFSELARRQSTNAFDFYDQTNQVAWTAFAEHPIIGGGIGAVLDTELASDQSYEVHNTYLGILGQTGILGFAAFAAIIVTAVRNASIARRRATTAFVKAMSEAVLAALAGCAIHAVGNFNWRLRHLWLIFALSTVIKYVADRERLAQPSSSKVVPPPGTRIGPVRRLVRVTSVSTS